MKNFKLVYEKISDFRKLNLAPVDTMGCDILAKAETPAIKRYETLTALQLSSQTKDQVTAEAICNLQKHSLTPQSIVNTSDKDLNELIKKVGFHNRKTIYMKKTAQILIDKYGGDIPSTLEEVMELPGIGPKMAHLIMQTCWNVNSGIGVDTHVHRISNRLGWVETKNPEETRKALEDWVPVTMWKEINHLLVGFGQTCCKPVGPLCSFCPVSDLCPSANFTESKTKSVKKKSKSDAKVTKRVKKAIEVVVKEEKD
jgi:endonuclease-3